MKFAISMSAFSILAASALAANPFLDSRDDKPVSAEFRGAEWSDEIEGEEIPLTARVVTTRLAKTGWGEVLKIEFVDLKSRATQHREIRPEYLIVTDDRILVLNESDNDAAVRRIAAMPAPPPFEPGDVYGIATGKFTHKDEPWQTKIEVKGDLCVYQSSHPSGHFKKVVWKRSVGLVEYSMGYGARADGFGLKRVAEKP